MRGFSTPPGLVGSVCLLLLSQACGDENIGQIENAPPTAVILGAGVVSIGAVVPFTGSSSFDEDGTVTDYAWDFGDGGTATGSGPQHIYNAAGTFTVSLTVTDNDGGTGTSSVQLTVSDNQAPTAVITASATGDIGGAVSFDGASSTDVDGTITAYAWDFGDGTTGTGPLFEQTFAAAGTFVVRLTVTDDDGATASATHTITVSDAPVTRSGEWNWFLTDESLRNLGLLCGTFQDSQLTIAEVDASLTITEHAGATNVAYTGTVTGNDFNVSNTQVLITQRISGSFTSATEFVGTYAIEGVTCASRPVRGVKR